MWLTDTQTSVAYLSVNDAILWISVTRNRKFWTPGSESRIQNFKFIRLKVQISLTGYIRTDRLKVRTKVVAFVQKAGPKFVITNLGLNITY